MEDNQITDNDKEDDKQDRIELVQRAVEGDKEAFTNLYTLTYSEVYHIVKVFIHNEDTAQDIVQETYYKSLRKIKQLKEPDKFPVWIKKIAVNTAKAHLRKVDWVLFSEADGEGGKSIAELQDERLEHIPEIVVDQAETKELIDQILGELDEKQRMVVGMFYYEQMSVNEIAEALNCSVNTVKSRLNYARKKIGKENAEQGSHEQQGQEGVFHKVPLQHFNGQGVTQGIPDTHSAPPFMWKMSRKAWEDRTSSGFPMARTVPSMRTA